MTADVLTADALTADALTADVLIVGFGPVGKLLAIQLGRSGHQVVVVDRQSRGYPLPRAVTHDSEFARIMQSIGLPPSRTADFVQPYDDLYHWRNAAGETLLQVDWTGFGPSGWHNTYFFHQPALEERMEQLIEELDTVTVLRGWDAAGHQETADGVQVQLRMPGPADGRSDDRSDDQPGIGVLARYVIGADGANSTVRQWIGSSWHDFGYFYDWLVVDVVPDPELRFPHVAVQSCDPGRPSTMVPGGPGRRRWEFMRLPGEDKDELNRTETAWRLLQPYGVEPANARLERHSVYTFQAGWARLWRRDRLLIAGDAAHLMPPFAGQGLGAGVRDAMNLAWKLSAVLNGFAAESLLETYGPERLTHVAQFIEFSIRLGRVICVTDPELARRRDQKLIAEWSNSGAAPTPPQPRLGVDDQADDAGRERSELDPALALLGSADQAGLLSIQGRVGADRQRLDDVLGGAGALLLRDDAVLATLPRALLDRLASIGIRTRLLESPVARTSISSPTLSSSPTSRSSAEHRLLDVDGSYGDWLAELGADAVLIRPDFYLYDTASADGVTAMLTGFLARLGSGIGPGSLVAGSGPTAPDQAQQVGEMR